MSDAKSQHLTGVQQIAELSRMRQNAAAWLLGISARRLRDHAAPRNTDGTYDGALLVRWREEVEKERLDIAGGDPLMVGGDGKDRWLSEYRKEKAREAHRKNEVAENKLVETGIITTQLLQMSHTFRQRAEAIERDHGPDVGAAIRDMIDEAQGACQRIFPALIERAGHGPAPHEEREMPNSKAQMSNQIPSPKPKKGEQRKKQSGNPMRKRGEIDRSEPKTKRDPKGRFVKKKKKAKKAAAKRGKKKKPTARPAEPKAKKHGAGANEPPAPLAPQPENGSPMRKRGGVEKKPVKRAVRRSAPRRGIIRTKY